MTWVQTVLVLLYYSGEIKSKLFKNDIALTTKDKYII